MASTRDRAAGLGLRLTRGIREHELLTFLLLSFGWSWGLYLMVFRPLGWVGLRRAQVVFAWGPLIGAALSTWLAGHDVRGWCLQLDPRNIALRWYLLALGLPLVLTDGSRVLVWLAGGKVSVADITLVDFLSTFAITLFLAGALEEFGWRGYLQTRLQADRSAVLAALVVGLVWALWHLPLAYQGAGAGYAAGEFIGLLIGLPLFSVVMAWLYNCAGGRLLPVMLFHAMINAPSPLTIRSPVPDSLELIGGVGQLAILVLVPLIIARVSESESPSEGHLVDRR